jgi:transposase
LELSFLLDDYNAKTPQYNAVTEVVKQLRSQLSETAELLKIKSIGLVKVAGFIAGVRDIWHFKSPRQVQKLEGFVIRENSSGKHQGQTTIIQRGRTRLRVILFRAAIALSTKNQEFQNIHRYYMWKKSSQKEAVHYRYGL